MKIGLIADDFTRINLEMEEGLKIINLSPATWRFDLALHNIDVLLVESAWLGFKGKWQHKIAKYDIDTMNQQLKNIVDYCNKRKIATIFWNKEDPVNYGRFKHNLNGFKVCLTTEKNMISEYRKNYKDLSDVSVMPFFFQPKLHNPKPVKRISELRDKVVFCGGLYATEFPERSERLKESINAIGVENVVVYDRFNRKVPGWEVIEGLDIKPSFNYQNSKVHYQSGLAQINVNSIDGSNTMFSRRMIELIACGANVVDITRFKGSSILSPFVKQVTNKNDIIKALETDAPCIDYNYLVEHYSAATFLKKLETYI